jgi:hypothetical protein
MKAKFLKILYLSSLFVAIVDAHSARGQKAAEQRERLLATILDGHDPYQVGVAYRSLFQLVGTKGLEDLLDHKNPGVAIQAAWELCRERAGKDPRGNVQRFLGFVEGRTQLELPLRWEVQLVGAGLSPIPPHPPARTKALEPYLGVAPSVKRVTRFRVELEPPPFKESALGISFPPDVAVKRENGKIVFTRGQASGFLSEAAFQTLHRLEPLRGNCSVLIGPKHTYIILFDKVGGSYVLAQIDSESGTIRWRANGWALDTMHGTGSWYHSPILVLTERQTAAFGAVSGGSYLEVYDRQSGRCSYRFATNLWYAPEK